MDRHYTLDTSLKWRNAAASLVWTHSAPLNWKVWCTWSAFRNVLAATMPTLAINVPSSIYEIKTGGELLWLLPDGKGELTAGFESSLYRALPQQVNNGSAAVRAAEYRPYVAWRKVFLERFTFDAGVRIACYSTSGYHSFTPAPSLNLYWNKEADNAALHLALSPQFLHQTGFADVGLSSNFWFPANAIAPRELAAGVSVCYIRSLCGEILTVGIEPYFRRILHDPEYSGILLDLIEKNYRLEEHLLNSNGFNAGFDFSANLAVVPWSAMANYSLGFARRRFPSSPNSYLPAMSEGLHSFNALVSRNVGTHWVLTASFVLASGRCYTPVKALYMLGENLMMVLGKRNSSRMPLYHRLDLSASYRFTTGGVLPLRHTVVISVINAYGNRNIELSTYRFSPQNGTFYRHDSPSLYRFLPSLSYTIDL